MMWINGLLALGFFGVLFLRSPVWSWCFELLILLATVLVFWQVSIYLAVCVLTFHGLYLVQLFKTMNLLGTTSERVSTRSWVQGLMIVLVLSGALGVAVFMLGMPSLKVLSPLTPTDLVEVANGEAFPLLLSVCLLASLLIFGLVTERRRR